MQLNRRQNLEGASEQQGQGARKALKPAAFLLLVVALIVLLTLPLVPSFKKVDAVKGIDDQSTGSVQVLAIGASSVARGFSPNRLYETQGIVARNVATAGQLPMTTRYLLEEALSEQGDVKVVVIDAAMFVRRISYNEQGLHYNEPVASAMAYSRPKLKLIVEMTEHYDDVDPVEQLVPVLRYHSRWNELAEEDFVDNGFRSDVKFAHGQLLSSESLATKGEIEGSTTEANDSITECIDNDAEKIEKALDKLSVRYLEEMVELCRSREVDVLLVKTPRSDWGDSMHDRAAYLADKVGVPFLDMNLSDVREKCGIDYVSDCYDILHANTLGSVKITDYLGEYLVEHYSLDDKHGDANSGFSDEDLRLFDEAVEDARLCQCIDLDDYLNSINRSRYTVFVAACGESVDGLSDELRNRFSELGFSGLLTLEENSSYVGVVDGGILKAEKASKSGSAASLLVSYKDGKVCADELLMQADARLDSPVELVSAGKEIGALASIKVGYYDEETEEDDPLDKAENKQGLNFVVYNRETGVLVDTSSFDTHGDCARTSDLAERG